ncbi:class I SAM-dependent methyltransferase [Streptomyces sp. NPDC054866]
MPNPDRVRAASRRPRPLPPRGLPSPAASRPGYPPHLFTTVEELAEQPLRGARAVDVGAGTGTATRLLLDRGARVVAVEPGPAMRAQLRVALPGVPLLRAVGDALPLADDAADLITYAQSWHWTDPADSLPEALRVLRPGGALALWWNMPDPDTAWTTAQEERLKSRLPGYHRPGISVRAAEITVGLFPDLRPVQRRLHWTRRVPLDVHLAHLGSRSYFAVLGPDETAPILAAERAHLLRLFPDGTVEEAYAVDLTVVRNLSPLGSGGPGRGSAVGPRP